MNCKSSASSIGKGTRASSHVARKEQQKDVETSELPPLTKRALGLAKVDVPGDWNYKDLLANELIGKYGEA